MGKKTTSATKKAKYAAHPPIAEANKKRRMLKHLKKHPGDLQTKSNPKIS